MKAKGGERGKANRPQQKGQKKGILDYEERCVTLYFSAEEASP